MVWTEPLKLAVIGLETGFALCRQKPTRAVLIEAGSSNAGGWRKGSPVLLQWGLGSGGSGGCMTLTNVAYLLLGTVRLKNWSNLFRVVNAKQIWLLWSFQCKQNHSSWVCVHMFVYLFLMLMESEDFPLIFGIIFSCRFNSMWRRNDTSLPD